MGSFVQFLTFALIFGHLTLVVISKSEFRGYGYNPPITEAPVYYPPIRDVPVCSSLCRPSTQCTSELDIRDETVPKEVPVPTINYQDRWEPKQVHIVTDYDVRENPCPIPVPLQDKEIRVEPRIREVEKVVKVRVARVRENVIVKKIDRVTLVPIVQSRTKPINVQHVRQVPAPVKIPTPKNVVQKKYRAEVNEVPVPVRIANIVDVVVNRVDKPIEVPSIRFQFCEKIQEIQVKANCPTAAPEPASQRVIGEGDQLHKLVVGHNAWNRQRRRDNLSIA